MQSPAINEPGLSLALRIGAALCFIGHGAFGVIGKVQWLPYFALFGIGPSTAWTVMPIVGTVDITVGALMLIYPTRALFLYAAIWTTITAALRPLAGEGIWEFVERAGNYGVPIALLALSAGSTAWLTRDTSAPSSRAATACRILQWTTVLLLAGHGALALSGKPLLITHLATVGASANAARAEGMLDLLLAAACVVLPRPGTFFGVLVWKLAIEVLFLVAGAPVWEFIERGGSYVAPLVAGVLTLRYGPSLRLPRLAVGSAGAAILLLLPLPLHARALSEFPGFSAELASGLKHGGLVLVCRHAATDHSREDAAHVDFNDPSTQRVLSEEGERQATAIGKTLREMGARFSEVNAARFQRTRRSAELMFGTAQAADGLGDGPFQRDVWTRWLSDPTADGQNRAIVTRVGIIMQALKGLRPNSVSEGDCFVIRPGEEYKILAQVKASGWHE